MTDYVATLVYLVPDAKISYTGLNVAYEDIDWQDDRPQPTKEYCDEIWPQVKYERDYAQVQRQRESRYELETDGIFFDAMRGDQDLTEWTAAVEVIKSELPYPAAPSEA